MKHHPPHSNEEPIRVWDLFLAGLAVLVLTGVVLDLVLDLEQSVLWIVSVADFVVCLIFLSDFIWRFTRAKNKAAFMKWGWVDLLSSIPMIDPLRWGRALQVVRVLRAVRSASHLIRVARRGQPFTVLLAVLLGCLVLALAGSMTMLHLEKDAPGATIHTAQDALWWAMATMSTVGYGDCYPVTGAGRVVAVVLMFTGIGFFGTLTAFLSTKLLRPAMNRDEVDLKHVLAKLEAMEKRLAELQPSVTPHKPE
jgi:voltage-gated potassium channel